MYPGRAERVAYRTLHHRSIFTCSVPELITLAPTGHYPVSSPSQPGLVRLFDLDPRDGITDGECVIRPMSVLAEPGRIQNQPLCNKSVSPQGPV